MFHSLCFIKSNNEPRQVFKMKAHTIGFGDEHLFYKNTRLIFARNLEQVKNNPSLSISTKSQILNLRKILIVNVVFRSSKCRN